jgi:Concanavalin A-like lectin/glucanases superfamily
MLPNPAWPYLRLYDDDQYIVGMDEALQVGSGGETYADKVKSIFGSSLIDYRRLNEGAGTAILDSSPKAHPNGTLSGATWMAGAGPDGGYAPLFDGVNDYGDIYSAGLNTDFTPAAFTVAAWCKVSSAGVWSDGTGRDVLILAADGNNSVVLQKQTIANQLIAVYTAGGTVKQVAFASGAPTGWFHFALTVTVSGNAMKVYLNGVQVGATQTSLGTWVGALASNLSVIGAGNAAGGSAWSGYIRDALIANRTATQAEIAQLAVYS